VSPVIGALSAVFRRAKWIASGRPNPPASLEMLFPQSHFQPLPAVELHAGYRLREWRSDDLVPYFDLIASAGMPAFSMQYWEEHLLAGGFFVVEHKGSGALAATCMAAHRPTARHPRAGALNWLAAHPEHAGHRLGRSVSAAVTARLVVAGYERIYLETHDFRLAAIRVYLGLGWLPLMYSVGMEARWRKVCAELSWPFTPEQWPRS
jgi:mycothiol synthase